MLSTIWNISSTRLFADVNPRIFTVFILWCCCPCIFLRPEGSVNMETCSISYWDIYLPQLKRLKSGHHFGATLQRGSMVLPAAIRTPRSSLHLASRKETSLLPPPHPTHAFNHAPHARSFLPFPAVRSCAPPSWLGEAAAVGGVPRALLQRCLSPRLPTPS
jgi:hypothetical protein